MKNMRKNQNNNSDGTPKPAEQEITVAGQLALSVKQIDKLIRLSKKTTRGWSTEKAIGHLLWHLLSRGGLCPICCLTQQFFRATKLEQGKMRQRVPVLFTHMLRKHHMYLLKEYEPYGNGFHGRIKAVGIYNPKTDNPREKDLARKQLDRMVKRGEISADDAIVARDVTGFLEAGAT
jgi:hypothetical protein